jgi:hypothetical protein
LDLQLSLTFSITFACFVQPNFGNLQHIHVEKESLREAGAKTMRGGTGREGGRKRGKGVGGLDWKGRRKATQQPIPDEADGRH